MKKLTKLLSIALCMLMLLTLLPMAALAAAGTYHVAGNAGLCGAEWDPAASANKMTLASDGLYEISYSNVSAGMHEFKVTDGSWDNSWGIGSSNFLFTLEQTSNVTIRFNADTKEISVYINGNLLVLEKAYYVAGNSGLCGSEWSPNAPSNKMTEAGGKYQMVYSNVAEGTYQFKITDGTWDNSWGGNGPGGNYQIDVAAGSTVTITFDPATGAISVDIQAGSGNVTPPAPKPITDCYVAGNAGLCGEEWAVAGAANKMTKGADGKFTITYTNVPAGDHKFKVTDGSWDRCWGGEGDLADGDGNYVLKLAAKSDVTITFDPEAKKISVAITAKEDAGSNPVTPPPAAGEAYTVTLYFQTPDESWGDAINAWIWTGEGESLPGYEDYHITWPGKSVQVDAADPDWYKLVVTTDAPDGFKFIFNGNGKQTADLSTTAQNASLWYVGDTLYTSKPVAAAPTGDTTPVVLLVALMGISAAAMLLLANKKKAI